MSTMSAESKINPISLAHLTVLDLAPPEMIRVAARCGYQSVGLRLIAVTDTTPGYPLQDDPAMLRETKAAMQEEGVTVNDVEFLKITPEIVVSELEGLIAAGAEIGAKHLITAPYEPDLGRLSETLAQLAELTAKYSMSPVLEFFPWTNVPDLHTVLSVVEKAGPEVGVLVDSLHFNRSNSSLDELAQVDPSRLRFMHLCDAPIMPAYTTEDLLFAGRAERLPPGEGDINLTDIVKLMPKDIPVALEIPMLEYASKYGSEAVAQRVIKATQEFLLNVVPQLEVANIC